MAFACLPTLLIQNTCFTPDLLACLKWVRASGRGIINSLISSASWFEQFTGTSSKFTCFTWNIYISFSGIPQNNWMGKNHVNNHLQHLFWRFRCYWTVLLHVSTYYVNFNLASEFGRNVCASFTLTTYDEPGGAGLGDGGRGLNLLNTMISILHILLNYAKSNHLKIYSKAH